MVISRNSFRSESAFVYETLPQNCLLGVVDLSALCLQDMKQWQTQSCDSYRDVRCVGVVACVRYARAVNLRVWRLLSPEGGGGPMPPAPPPAERF